ncbi:MAG TPA: hypothetical protein VH044_09665 [Polyangiaceae bacterium]|jgi:hypothetical protein|nr:hypothetical protein [Polyangiaceae bacterium]
MQDIVNELTVQPREGLVDQVTDAVGARPRAEPVVDGRPWTGLIGAWSQALARISDGQLALLVSAALFVLAAWPLSLVDVPPFQDLPNHLATVAVIEHPERYPEFIFNGYFKTNSILFTWLMLAGKVVGLKAAARSFTLLVLALGALAFPRFVLSFGGRKRMVVAAFFAWPMVHNWFVSMGMLDFALSVPLAMLLLVQLNEQRQKPSVGRGVAIGALALVTWHAHVFPLLVVLILLAVHVIALPGWPARREAARWLVLPTIPAMGLVAVSLRVHLTEPVGAMTGFVALGRLLPPWELFYNMWAEWFYGFTWLEIATLVPCLGMGLWAIYRWRDEVPFFGPAALLVLAALYFFSPYVATNWFHVNSRFVPFLWLAALVRLPERMPRRIFAVLGACALSCSLGMGVDYVRLRAEWTRFTAGMSSVPEGAKLLPLVFRGKIVSDNTDNLLHAWGFYVTDKLTSAPLLFAHSRSFPVMYREPPEPRFNHLVLENFAPSMASPEWSCGVLRSGGVAVDDCEALWHERWAEFWRSAEPKFDHVLMWDAPRDVLALVPAGYRVAFQRDELTIFERQDPSSRGPSASRQ